MLLDGIVDLLKASDIAGGRVYMFNLPRGYMLSAIVVHGYNGEQEMDFAGPVGIRADQVQFDCYGDTGPATYALKEAVRELIISYVGTLPGGIKVSGCYLERDTDMPFLPNANVTGIANRSLIGVRVVSERV